MKAFNKIKSKVLILIVVLWLLILNSVSSVHAYSNPSAVPLLTVTNFAALAHTLISSPLGGTVINNGDLGVDSSGTCTGFASPCTGSLTGILNGGAIQYQNAVSLQAQTDATAAVTNIGLRPADLTLSAQLGGQTLTAGVYQVPADATNLTGDLTLNGDANSVFIFHLTSTLITDSGSRVVLTGGVQSCNVFWKVDSSATFNGTTSFVGTVLAADSITFPAGGATLNGRVIAQTGAITFNNTTVNKSSCASTSSSTSSNTIDNSPPVIFCPTIIPNVIAPIIIESKRIDANSVYLKWGPYSGTDKFNVRYGIKNGEWLYNADVTGFSTTIKSLPTNQPIWVQVAARNECQVGNYETAKLVGGPMLPNSGYESSKDYSLWYLVGIFFTLLGSTIFVLQKKH